MFKMADAGLRGRYALIVEDEPGAAAEIVADLRRSGGEELGILHSVAAALRFVQRNPPPDCLILDVRQADALGRPLAEVFKPYGVEVVFVTGFDDWYSDDEEDATEYVPSHYAHG